MPALAIWTVGDGLLSAIAPLGLAAAAGTALVVDLDPAGPRYPGTATLADLVADGPRRSDLTPSRSGIAVLPNGGVTIHDSGEVIRALMAGWPEIVLRVDMPASAGGLAPVVPVRPLLPGFMKPGGEGPSVYQDCGFGVTAPGSGPVLPPPGARLLKGMLEGVVAGGSRWVRAWKRVWGWPWH
jgi:hypothetical protein